MEISFDPVQRDQKLKGRRLDFADADMVFAGPMFTFEDGRFAYP
ncbi:hypothetical protein [Sphingomonas mollis]|nr:hypothetical protein [Sphingomonas sp. BT553]